MRNRTFLREARDAANKKQEQVAEEVGVDRTTIGRWERGESKPEAGEERAAYAAALGITMTELHAALSNMPLHDDEIPTPLKIALAVEQAATEIRSHVANVVHGLLQTPDYAAAIAKAVGTTATPEDYVRRNVEQRKHRQRRVLDGHVALSVVQPEATLRSRLGNNRVMGAQMRHLAEMAQEEHVTVQVVPFDVGQYEAQRIGTFSLNTLVWATTPTVEFHGYGGIRLIDDAPEVAYFADSFEHACKRALAPKASVEFIEQLASEWESRT